MRIQMYSAAYGMQYTLDSDNPNVIALWLTDLVPMLAETGRNAAMPPWKMEVYPSGDYNARTWPALHTLGVKELQWLIDGFEKMKDETKEMDQLPMSGDSNSRRIRH